MALQDDIETLQRHEAFARLLENIHQSREQWLSALGNANEKEALSIAARIATFDQLLLSCDAQEVFRRHGMSPCMVKQGWWQGVKLRLAQALCS